LLTETLKGIPDWRFFEKKDPTFKFLSDPHEYLLREQRLWSPSGLFLQVRYVDPTYYTEETRYRGSYVHHATHLIDDGDTGVWNKIHHLFLGFVEAFAEFKEIWKWRPRLREVPIYNTERHYATTPDGEGLILQGDEAIVEIKTGVMPWWTAIQTAAHDMAIHAWDKDQRKTRRRIGVELKKNGKFRVKEFDDEDDYYVWQSNLKTVQRHLKQPPQKLTKILSY
jgi:hypothetical protein